MVTNRHIGSPVERVEDLRFLRGRGEYIDDVEKAGGVRVADTLQQHNANVARWYAIRRARGEM